MQQLERVPRAASAALLQIASSPSDASQATLRLFDVVVRATPSGGGRRGAAGAGAGPKLADVENKNDAVIVSAGLISLAMTSSLPATAASHRALRKFAKVRTEREIAAAAATASDAAAEARESAALASQSRRGAASAAAKALVESSQEWARAVAEGALELASILEATGDGGGVDPWYEASRALDPSSSSSSSSSSPPPPPSAAARRVATASCRVLADVEFEVVPLPSVQYAVALAWHLQAHIWQRCGTLLLPPKVIHELLPGDVFSIVAERIYDETYDSSPHTADAVSFTLGDEDVAGVRLDVEQQDFDEFEHVVERLMEEEQARRTAHRDELQQVTHRPLTSALSRPLLSVVCQRRSGP